MNKPAILVIDDEPANLAVFSNLLSPLHHVFVCKTGEAGLERARRRPVPDLILLDVMMPRMDGFEVIARLKEDPTTAEIPVIFVTALGEEVDEERGFLMGAVDYITKPVRPVVVVARVKAQIDYAFARRRLREQNDALLREVFHRVKNNLNVIASLLRLHSSRIGSPDQALVAFRHAEERIMAMSMVHQDLYDSPDHGQINAGDFIRRYGERFFRRSVVRDRVTVNTHADRVLLPLETAIPCGIILHELIRNAADHAFPGGRTGTVDIRVGQSSSGAVELIVRDDGCGYAIADVSADSDAGSDAGHGHHPGFGGTLVKLMADQIEGTVRINSTPGAGTECVISFPHRHGGFNGGRTVP